MRRIWWIGLALTLVAIGFVDSVFLDQLRGYFRSGFNTPVLRSLVDRSLFAATGAVQDAALIALSGALALAVLRRAQPATRWIAALIVPLYATILTDLIVFRVYRVFGDVLSWQGIFDLAGGARGAAAEAASEEPVVFAMLLASFGLLCGFLWVASRWLPRQGFAVPHGPRVRTLLGASAGLLVVSALVLKWSLVAHPSLHAGLYWKPSGRLLHLVAGFATDLDRDGFGWLDRPVDPDPLDPERHPFSIEVPANGVDENGLGGDLPDTAMAPAVVQAASSPQRERPDFLLLFLETFRGDLIGQERDGRTVTPFLNELARSGAATPNAWANSPATTTARAQLFQGRLGPQPDGRTLIDDFAALGYETAYFSGQDDSFRRSRSLVGWDRAETFFDARDSAKPSSRTRSPASLQISWKTLLKEVGRFLDQRDRSRPLFLYVNIVDTHYPYHHEELDDLLGVETIERADIRPENVDDILATYRNAAANVDAAIAQLVDDFESRPGPDGSALLVTADHGQAFYERGQLGHGQDLDALQAAVPLIVRGIGGTWPEPISHADLRGLILGNLFAARPSRARFVADPGRRILQFTGRLEKPTRIALRSLAGSLLYDFQQARFWRRDERDEPAAAPTRGDRDGLIHAWEATRWMERP